jgi:hypothetical protein
MSPHARSLVQEGRVARAWQRFVDALHDVPQPNNDRYVILFCIFLFGVICGLGIASKQQEGREQADRAMPPHMTTTKGTP